MIVVLAVVINIDSILPKLTCSVISLPCIDLYSTFSLFQQASEVESSSDIVRLYLRTAFYKTKFSETGLQTI